MRLISFCLEFSDISRSFSVFKPAISQSSCLQLGSKSTELARLPYRRNAAVLSCNQNLLLLFLILPLTNELRITTNVNPRVKKSNKIQQYTDIYLMLNYSTCFGRPSRQSSGVNKTVAAASGTDHTIWGTSFLKRD